MIRATRYLYVITRTNDVIDFPVGTLLVDRDARGNPYRPEWYNPAARRFEEHFQAHYLGEIPAGTRDAQRAKVQDLLRLREKAHGNQP